MHRITSRNEYSKSETRSLSKPSVLENTQPAMSFSLLRFRLITPISSAYSRSILWPFFANFSARSNASWPSRFSKIFGGNSGISQFGFGFFW
ncbi:hypothetical protein CIPAW_03G242600 [Carya illinoinensis]|uniref:Uncharacterized protein n=1 Tax=Carya illinoinensis TaxID=32201 RepID=A0A8T1R8L3_CARIL|nr:hypothetical protein CIPAW_03G242600 [Carya illinoinensis]